MTDSAAADRLEALQRRRSSTAGGKRRRPAEASRVLVAGAGAAAALTMMTAMAQSDGAVQPAEVVVVDSPVLATAAPLVTPTPESSVVNAAPASRSQAVQTITIARPERAQITNGRTGASR